MRRDAGLNGDAQYIEQITWLLFLKAFDAHKEEEILEPQELMENYLTEREELENEIRDILAEIKNKLPENQEE